MQLEVITPETKIFSGEAEAVQLPGIEGSFQLLNDHAPIIAALTNGNVKVNLTESFKEDKEVSKQINHADDKEINIEIKGGVVEMLNNKLIVLAE